MRLLVLLLMFFLPLVTFSQDCPEFEVTVTDTDKTNDGLGSIEISLGTWNNNFSLENFALKQKVNSVSGLLGFEYTSAIKDNKVIFSGLVNSDQLLLKQYVVLFSHNSCKNGELIEVGLFQIK